MWLRDRLGASAMAAIGVAAVMLAVYLRAMAGPPVDFGAAVALREGRSPYADALAWKAAGYVTSSECGTIVVPG